MQNSDETKFEDSTVFNETRKAMDTFFMEGLANMYAMAVLMGYSAEIDKRVRELILEKIPDYKTKFNVNTDNQKS